MIKLNSIRYIITSKDKTKILTYKGFSELNDIRASNPKLFPDTGTAKQALLASYPEGIIDDVVFIKIEINYNELT